MNLDEFRIAEGAREWRQPLECAVSTALSLSAERAWSVGQSLKALSRATSFDIRTFPARKAKAGSSPRTPKPRGTLDAALGKEASQ